MATINARRHKCAGIRITPQQVRLTGDIHDRFRIGTRGISDFKRKLEKKNLEAVSVIEDMGETLDIPIDGT